MAGYWFTWQMSLGEGTAAPSHHPLLSRESPSLWRQTAKALGDPFLSAWVRSEAKDPHACTSVSASTVCSFPGLNKSYRNEREKAIQANGVREENKPIALRFLFFFQNLLADLFSSALIRSIRCPGSRVSEPSPKAALRVSVLWGERGHFSESWADLPSTKICIWKWSPPSVWKSKCSVPSNLNPPDSLTSTSFYNLRYVDHTCSYRQQCPPHSWGPPGKDIGSFGLSDMHLRVFSHSACKHRCRMDTF